MVGQEWHHRALESCLTRLRIIGKSSWINLTLNRYKRPTKHMYFIFYLEIGQSKKLPFIMLI